MPSPRTRRTRSPHPGVILVRRRNPSGSIAWRARFKDPETGLNSWETLDPDACSTREVRAEWATRKSALLAKRRTEIESGAPIDERTPLVASVESYFRAAVNLLRPSTVATYRKGVGAFVEWARSRRILHTGEIRPATLAQFRQDFIARRATGARRGKKAGQGTRVPLDRPRSPSSVNHDLRSLKCFLNAARKLGQMPFLSRDTISERLESIPMIAPEPEPLSAGDVRGLLAAALRHDAATWQLTRREHAADAMLRAANRTPRYPPIAAFVAFVVLSGCRLGEALALRWTDVDLDAPDMNGVPVGEIRLKGTATKTKMPRRIDLAVSPALRALLTALKLRAAGTSYVFGGVAPMPAHHASNAAVRLRATFGAPGFSWQRLRQTTGTFLTNAPGIFGAASAYRSAKQLGHSVTIAERYYVDLVRGIRADAHTLDAVLGVEDLLAEFNARVRGAACPVLAPAQLPTAAPLAVSA